MATPIRKVVISEFGDVSKVSVVDSTIEPPAKGEIQVSVLYSCFGGADINMRNGTYPMQKSAPLTPGYCFAGRVRALGKGCNKNGGSAFRVGDLVTALTVYGSEAQLINIPERYLVHVPEGLDIKQVVGMPLDWTTAYGMVERAAKVKPGQKVFVHGMSGSVGYALVTLSQLRGATVYGTASERNHAALRDLGAIPFVYTDKKWIDEVRKIGGVHAVFDPLGFESLDESYAILTGKEKSILVSYGGNLATLNEGEGSRSQFASMAKLFSWNLKLCSNKATTFFYISRDQKTFRPELEAVMELARQGKIAVPVKKVWDMEDIKDAHNGWGKASGIGSLMIKVSDDKADL
jgi:NADPH:quinone reductase-like Zn-dependent oxidoreductase